MTLLTDTARTASILAAADGKPIAAAVPHWQQELKDAVRDPRQLCRLLELPAEFEAAAVRAAAEFPLFAPKPFVAQIERGNPGDPLLRQILPLEAELSSPPGFTADPVGDLAARKAPSLLHKYHGRALLITTGACAVHCRYCFRRHYPYSESQSPRSRRGLAAGHSTRSPPTRACAKSSSAAAIRWCWSIRCWPIWPSGWPRFRTSPGCESTLGCR